LDKGRELSVKDALIRNATFDALLFATTSTTLSSTKAVHRPAISVPLVGKYKFAKCAHDLAHEPYDNALLEMPLGNGRFQC
jgi:hypothetical protein